jgi:hypothetical protein
LLWELLQGWKNWSGSWLPTGPAAEIRTIAL